MNREEFIKKFKSAKNTIDKDEIFRVINDSLAVIPNNAPGMLNAVIVMEEFSELQKEISKSIRGKMDKVALIEEIADSQLGIFYLMKIFDISEDEIIKAMNIKLERQKNKNEGMDN